MDTFEIPGKGKIVIKDNGKMTIEGKELIKDIMAVDKDLPDNVIIIDEEEESKQ